MKKIKNSFHALTKDEKWTKDVLTGERRRNCADNAYLRYNGPITRGFSSIVDILDLFR